MSDQATSKTGFLNLYLGGSGTLAADPFKELWKADGGTVPAYAVVLDTDNPPPGLLDRGLVDGFIPVRLDADQIRAVKATPQSFGPTVEEIAREVGMLLSEEELCHGARTTRCLAQLLFEVRRGDVAAALNHHLREFMHRGGCNKILPVLVASSGGGTGSSLIILLAAALLQNEFRNLVLQSLTKGLLLTPLGFVVEPHYRAIQHAEQPDHTSKILGNAMAFRIESARIEKLGGFKNIYHLGLSNTKGAVLDSERDVARVLGTCLYQFEKHYEAKIKPRTVDTSDLQGIFGRYTGQDVLEALPKRVRPPFAAVAPSDNGRS